MNGDEDTDTTASMAEPEAAEASPADESPDADEPVTESEHDADDAVEPDDTTAGNESDAADSTESDDSSTPMSPVGDDLVDRVAAHDEQLASEVQSLIERAFELKGENEELDEQVDDLSDQVDTLRAERESLKQRLVQKQADFKNYKERSKKKQAQVKERATEDLVERIVPVRDNLVRALDQGEGADIRDGVEATLRDFDRILDDENVEEVSPEPGSDVDPQRHEVMVRVDSEQPDGAIVDVYRPGYEMAGKVIQTAQVTVSNGADYDPSSDAVALGGEVDESDEGADDATEASSAADEDAEADAAESEAQPGTAADQADAGAEGDDGAGEDGEAEASDGEVSDALDEEE
ncbi:nucleotide exchange factor GrpE [Haloarchaeobius sp. DFWS5]|uniref:nucleotide exchange factor GrpE n=1 Tax=Haloarchaeobius sp. DFWS5 TaxID=3446114 RepID=UPI003EB93541